MECIVCGEQITNPISQERLQEQLSAWISEVLPKFKKRMDIAPIYSPVLSEEKCIITKKPIKVCPFCFWKEANELLKDQISEIKEDLERQFNYEIFPPSKTTLLGRVEPKSP